MNEQQKKDQFDHDALVDQAIAAIERVKKESRLSRADKMTGLDILKTQVESCMRAIKAGS